MSSGHGPAKFLKPDQDKEVFSSRPRQQTIKLQKKKRKQNVSKQNKGPESPQNIFLALSKLRGDFTDVGSSAYFNLN